MTNQEVYDRVKSHLLTQKVKSIEMIQLGSTLQRVNRFRGANGAKCSIGCLIPDSVYRPEMENSYTATKLIWDFSEIAEILKGIDGHLLFKLQQIHDTRNPQDWQKSLEDLAINLKLIP